MAVSSGIPHQVVNVRRISTVGVSGAPVGLRSCHSLRVSRGPFPGRSRRPRSRLFSTRWGDAYDLMASASVHTRDRHAGDRLPPDAAVAPFTAPPVSSHAWPTARSDSRRSEPVAPANGGSESPAKSAVSLSAPPSADSLGTGFASRRSPVRSRHAPSPNHEDTPCIRALLDRSCQRLVSLPWPSVPE
jgi:hypothetical protein